jgi:hypothetical protein
VVAACRANHPNFGQVKAPTPTADIKPGPASGARQVAAPASAGDAGVAVTSGARIPVSPSLPTGASPVTPRIPVDGLVDPKSVKIVALTCLIGPADEGTDQVTLTGSTASVVIGPSNGPLSKGLGPNECAFKDRALRYPQEPTYLCFDASIRAVGFQASVTGTNRKGGSFYPIILADGLRFSGSGAEVLAHALNGPNQFYTFMVYSGHVGGQFCWIVDKFAEGKSPPA